MPDRSLDSLSSEFYPKACEWIARVTARGIAVMVVQTSRTPEEAKTNVANGTSRNLSSLHLPRMLRWNQSARPLAPADAMKADAMDIAPWAVWQLHGDDKLQWDTSDPAWGIIGEEAERVGLRWGGRWHDPFDPGHAELILPWTGSSLAAERARTWPVFKA